MSYGSRVKFVKSETSPLQLRQRGKSFGQIVPNCSTFLRKFGIRLGAVINPQIISKKQTVCVGTEHVVTANADQTN